MHNFDTANKIITEELKFLVELGFDNPVATIGSGRMAVDDDMTKFSEVLTVFYTSKPSRRTVQVEYDSGVMKLSPIIRVQVVHQEGLKVIKRLDVSRFMEHNMKRRDAYRVFSGFWSGLGRAPIGPDDEIKFIRFAMETLAPVLKTDLKPTILGKEWPVVHGLPR